MFPIITPVTLNMPDLAQAGSLTRMPWPDGSVISARLMATDVPGNALLMLGSYRLLAQVPPATPMGEVWLMMINRQMPARFALLTDVQVLQMLAGMLETEQSQAAGRAAPNARQTQHAVLPGAANLAGTDASEWPNLSTPQRSDGKGLPWTGEAAADGNTLLWYDKKDEQPRGMLHRRVDGGYFTLSGRVDLDRLGGISFNLSGTVASPHNTGSSDAEPAHSQDWHLRLQAARDTHLDELRHDLQDWILEYGSQFPVVSADIGAGLPDSGTGKLTERTG